MRITHVITRGDVGGAQTQVVELATAQRRAGETVGIVAGCDGPAMERARAAGVSVTVVPALLGARTGSSLRPAFNELTRVVGQADADIVHGHSSHAGLLARLVARRAGLPSVYTAHGWPFQSGAAIRQRVKSVAGEFVGGRVGDAVICLTEREAQAARRAFVVAANRVVVIPNGIADVDVHRDLVARRGRSTTVLVMVARFAPPKLQVDLIERLANLGGSEWELRLIGDGPDLAAAESVAAALGDRVRFLGHRDDVAGQLADADIGVLWSRYEGMPVSILESMRAGLCCVASDLPGVRDLFGEPPAGIAVAPSDRLDTVLHELMADPGRVDALGVAARERYLAEFTAEKMMLRTRQVYESVIDRRRTRGGGGSTR